MSATPKGIKGPPKLIRILMLPLLIILLLLLVTYAALPYLPLNAPQRQAALTPIAPLTEEPTATPAAAIPTALPEATATPEAPPVGETETPAPAAAPTEVPSPTYTPVVVVAATDTATAAPLAAAPTATRARPSATPTPTQTTAAPAGDIQALAETAVPAPTATAPLVAAAPTPIPPRAETVVRPTLAPPPAAAPVVATTELLGNNTFARGYQDNGVATGWRNFSNSNAEFSYRADTWPPVLNEPGVGQTMRIRNADLPDRYVGIYQTVNVIPGRVYTFSIAGLVRTNAGDVQHTDFGYRMQVGFDTLGGHNWKQVPEWYELPWDEQLRVQPTYRIDAYTTTVEAETDRLTVFVRAWKKWADAGEGAFDVTRASLVGPAIVHADGDVQALGMPVTGLGEATLWQQLRIAITLGLLAVLLGGALWRFRPWQAR